MTEPNHPIARQTAEREIVHRENKVPEPTVSFWAIKILATTVGETAADLLSSSLHLGTQLTSVVMAVVFLAVFVV